ncbi:MAG: enoyl-[acyl-carrier-protein] reductase [Gammaproteobacteria bacterium TMED119]|nr:MAG: enoyl-[acyl-carrier-protein] reductase [Gammaproteobacteria bacterium TMED119]RCL45746.1 MAG: SDR family NAD(P)-dependent oxidoreductase [Candidatus Thioglobus sp.]|tara:strand:- start:214 stop:996 length:783 start_codon:yes stop_codon:yes gene_type:complete
MGFLENKKALIIGVASNRSIAWGIAQAMHQQGAELAFTYQNDRLQSRVEKMAQDCSSSIVLPCDVASDDNISALFTQLGEHWSEFDILVHSVAFAPKEELEGDFVERTTRAGSMMAHDISSYSLTALAKAARPMLQGHASAILSLSYLGAEKAMPNYNVMGLAKASLEANTRYMAYALGPDGIRVNCISAGPIRTLAAAGIGDFRKMLEHVEQNAPLRKNVTIEEVGNAAAFLCSDLASGITGEVTYVDAGYNIVGMSGY